MAKVTQILYRSPKLAALENIRYIFKCNRVQIKRQIEVNFIFFLNYRKLLQIYKFKIWKIYIFAANRSNCYWVICTQRINKFSSKKLEIFQNQSCSKQNICDFVANFKVSAKITGISCRYEALRTWKSDSCLLKHQNSPKLYALEKSWCILKCSCAQLKRQILRYILKCCQKLPKSANMKLWALEDLHFCY